MSEFSENEKLDTVETENAEELSTIFSAPAEHKKTAENVKKRKRLPIIIASFLAVAVLVGGTIGVVKLIPEKEEEETAPTVEQITVLDLKSDDLKSATVTNENGTFKLYSEKGGEGDSQTVSWYLEGYDKELIDSSSVSSTVTSLCSIKASMEITKLTASDCGLDNPQYKAELVANDGKTVILTVGKDSVDTVNGGCYIKLFDSDKIYLADSTVKSAFEFTALDKGKAESLSKFPTDGLGSEYKGEDGNITSFESITVSGKNFAKPVIIVPNDDDDEQLTSVIGYLISSPQKRIAKDEAISPLFTAFQQGIAVSGLYSFDTSSASIAAFGLNDPDFVATMKIGGKSLSYKFKLQEDGYYAAFADGEKVIKKAAASSLSFIDFTETDFYASWVCINSIDDIKTLTINTPEKSYEFGIKANPDEEAEDKYIITYNGAEIDCQSFQSFYQELISISCTDFTVDNLGNTPEYSFVFTFKDEIGGENRINFIKANDTRYQYTSDGVALGKVNSSALKKIVRELEKLVE